MNPSKNRKKVPHSGIGNESLQESGHRSDGKQSKSKNTSEENEENSEENNFSNSEIGYSENSEELFQDHSDTQSNLSEKYEEKASPGSSHEEIIDSDEGEVMVSSEYDDLGVPVTPSDDLDLYHLISKLEKRMDALEKENSEQKVEIEQLKKENQVLLGKGKKLGGKMVQIMGTVQDLQGKRDTDNVNPAMEKVSGILDQVHELKDSFEELNQKINQGNTQSVTKQFNEFKKEVTEKINQNDQKPQAEQLLQLSKLIEGRTIEMNQLIERISSKSKEWKRIEQSYELFDEKFQECDGRFDVITRQIAVISESIRVEQDALLNMGNQSESLKDCIEQEIEDNSIFREKLNHTLSSYREKLSRLHSELGDIQKQQKILQSQLLHISRKKRDKDQEDRELYNIYMEQAKIYEDRFVKLEQKIRHSDSRIVQISENIHGLVVESWYKPENPSDILDVAVCRTLKTIPTHSPIPIKRINESQYRIGNRNLTLQLNQNEEPYVKLKTESLLLSDFLMESIQKRSSIHRQSNSNSLVSSPRSVSSQFIRSQGQLTPRSPRQSLTPRKEKTIRVNLLAP